MVILKKQNQIVEKIIGQQIIDKKKKYRFLHFCVIVNYNDKILLFNNLTKSLIELEINEYENLISEEYNSDKDFYIKNWFMVNIDHDDIKLADQLENIARLLDNKEIYGYVILPTTDCNARCFYCYENKIPKKYMSSETALATADFITKKSANSKFSIEWFGGEPLCNIDAINTISTILNERQLNFSSSMITNGYLFDGELINNAKKIWHLKSVTITLDGREQVYNKIKNYIYNDNVNPYNKVIDNIHKLLKAEIYVTIRLNLGKHNINELYLLIDELISLFGKNKFLKISVSSLVDDENVDNRFIDSPEHSYSDLFAMRNYIENKDILFASKLSYDIQMYSCMAVNPHIIQINPDGDIGKCDHHIYDRLIGNVFSDSFDTNSINSWSGVKPPISLCATCTHYPTCKEIIQCPSGANTVCNKNIIQLKDDVIKNQVITTYKSFFKN